MKRYSVKISPSCLSGRVTAPPSKSISHRALICAALADGESVISNLAFSEDILATVDALKAVGLPTVEVHISDVSKREDFRQISYVREACIATISGHGTDGYTEAIDLLLAHKEQETKA